MKTSGMAGTLEPLEGRRLMTATALPGIGFGTAGSWANSGDTYQKALDGNIWTSFDAPQADGAVVGLDLGSAKTISAVRFAPRDARPDRMVGGRFQGSNTSATTGFVDLATITAVPARETMTTLNVASPGAYRWVRYVSPDGGWGNVAEVQFLGESGATTPTTTPVTGTGTTKLAGTPFGTNGSWANTGNTFDRAVDGSMWTYFDAPQADDAVVGLDLGSAKTISAVRFAPRDARPDRMVGGRFQGSNTSSTSGFVDLATITATPAIEKMTTLNVASPGAYRWVRYVSPDGGWGNVAEVEFHGSSSGTTTTSPTPTPVPTPISTPTSTPAPGAPQPRISLMQSSVTAGMAVHANAVNSVLTSGSPVTARYEWDFGDPNGKYNKLTGYNAAHVYDTPGTYTVTLKVTNEAGASATATQNVTVSADNRRTVYVDAVSGSDANPGTSPTAAVRTAARANQMLADDTRLLFARGQTHMLTASVAATYSNITIGAYGSGAKPVLQWAGPSQSWWEMIASSASSTRDLMVQDLVLDGGTGTNPIGFAARGRNVTIRNSEFRHMVISITAAGNPDGLLVQDNVQPANAGVTDYFLWVQGTNVAVLGNRVGPGGLFAIRSSGISGTFANLLVAHNTLSNDARGNLRVQKGSYAYVTDNTFEGSGVEFGPLGGGDGTQDPAYQTVRTSWAVLENNRATFTNYHGVRLVHGLDHASVRNNVFRRDGVAAAVTVEGYNADYGRRVSDLYVVNNTGINMSNSGQFLALEGSENSAEITMANNLYSAPNLVTGSTGGAGVHVAADDLGSFRQIRNNVWSLPANREAWTENGINYLARGWVQQGYRTEAEWEALPQVQNDYFETDYLSGNYTPASNTFAASGAVSAAGVFTDIYGKARPSSGKWSVGAVQV